MCMFFFGGRGEAGMTQKSIFRPCHFVVLLQSFVAAVEKVCFGEDGEHLGTRTLGRTQGRACLAVGSLVKHLSSSGQHQQADRLAQTLESWLGQHGEGMVLSMF